MKYISEKNKAYYEKLEIALPRRQLEELRAYARVYQTSVTGMLSLIVSYYFGDGADHLRCEHCGLWRGYCVGDLEPGTQLEIEGRATLLDKGSVVIGNPFMNRGI